MENVYLNGAILGMSKREIDRRLDEIVEFAEVDKFLETPVKRYSSGMRVRLAFAVAAHLDPEILIIDEVLSVGDYSFQAKCLDKMRSIAADEGRTVLYVSHNLVTVENLCPRALLLVDGQLAFDGPTEETVAQYLHMFPRAERRRHTGRLRPRGGRPLRRRVPGRALQAPRAAAQRRPPLGLRPHGRAAADRDHHRGPGRPARRQRARDGRLAHQPVPVPHDRPDATAQGRPGTGSPGDDRDRHPLAAAHARGVPHERRCARSPRDARRRGAPRRGVHRDPRRRARATATSSPPRTASSSCRGTGRSVRRWTTMPRPNGSTTKRRV